MSQNKKKYIFFKKMIKAVQCDVTGGRIYGLEMSIKKVVCKIKKNNNNTVLWCG